MFKYSLVLALGLFFGGCVMSAEKSVSLAIFDMTPLQVSEFIDASIERVEAVAVPVHSVENQVVMQGDRSTPVRIYKHSDAPSSPVILMIHGGAWVAGSLDTHDNLARYLCHGAQAIVASVGYTLAPEGKFPLQLNQCMDAVTWIIENATSLGVDVSRLAVAGDSAGGNMAAALCLMIRDQGGPKISLQVLINPAPDLTCGGTIERKNDALDVMRWQAVQYVVNPEDVNNGYVSPLVASDLSNLPPALVIVAELDPLRAGGQAYADRLNAAGVEVSVYCQPGIGHLAGTGAKASSVAVPSLEAAVAALKKAFQQSQVDCQ